MVEPQVNLVGHPEKMESDEKAKARERSRKYREANKAKLKARRDARPPTEEQKAKRRAYLVKYYAKNREKIAAKAKAHRSKPEVAQARKAYYENNKDLVIKRVAESRKKAIQRAYDRGYTAAVTDIAEGRLIVSP